MSNSKNHRRGEEARTDNGPRWEPGGSNNSCVARCRRFWKKTKNRTFRRTGKVTPKFHNVKDGKPLISYDEENE